MTARPTAHPPPIDEQPACLSRASTLIDPALQAFVRESPLAPNLREAVEYALLGGGKRLRPCLAIECGRAVGGEESHAFPAACAVELIHAFSLVHDDLPAMDDDDLRRGRPTVHVKFGEAMAILTGDAMTILAFRALTSRIDDTALVGLLCRELADASADMITGQVFDTLGGLPPSLSQAESAEIIHRHKTGALIRASCRMGAISALWRLTPSPDADAILRSPSLTAITAYAEAVGLMFQIVDDLLDVEQTPENTGKRTGKDADAGKTTYPGAIGVEASRREVDRLRDQAILALAPLDEARAAPLAALCEFLSVRTS